LRKIVLLRYPAERARIGDQGEILITVPAGARFHWNGTRRGHGLSTYPDSVGGGVSSGAGVIPLAPGRL